MKIHASENFSYDKKENVMVSELSTLGYRSGFVPAVVFIQSKKTGRVVQFIGIGVQANQENEIIKYIYAADDVDRSLDSLRVFLYND